jgi:hypothetical protein
MDAEAAVLPSAGAVGAAEALSTAKGPLRFSFEVEGTFAQSAPSSFGGKRLRRQDSADSSAIPRGHDEGYRLEGRDVIP